MGIKKIRERKKKQRELESKKKVQKRREVLRKQAKYDKQLDNDVRASREKLMPYVSPEKERLRVQKQIEHNMQLIKGLEDEYEREQATRRQINDKLESEGHETLQEKVEAMGKEAIALADEAGQIDLAIAPKTPE
jgi:hypothetical protein